MAEVRVKQRGNNWFKICSRFDVYIVFVSIINITNTMLASLYTCYIANYLVMPKDLVTIYT